MNFHDVRARQYQHQLSINISAGTVGHLIGRQMLPAQMNDNQYLLVVFVVTGVRYQDIPVHLWQSMWILLDGAPHSSYT
jgi:hypothetical protein